MHDRPQAKQRHWPDRPVGATGSHVPCKSLSQARATSTPGAIWAVNRLPPDSSRGSKASPVSTPPESFDTSSVVRSRSPSWLIPAALNGATFPVTLTTTALYRSSSRWFAASACTAAAEGHRANSTLLLHLLHSTAFRIWVFYIQPPSTFVAHRWTTRERLAQRSRDSSFAMAKRASGALEYRRVLVVRTRRVGGGLADARKSRKAEAGSSLPLSHRHHGDFPEYPVPASKASSAVSRWPQFRRSGAGWSCAVRSRSSR